MRARLVVALLSLGLAGPLAAQDTARVVVQYVAGADLYLSGGTTLGIRPGDTLTARKIPSGEAVGPLLVKASTPDRAVVGFLGAPFLLSRGDTLFVTIAHATVPAAAPVVAAVPSMGATPPPRPRPLRTASGSLALDFDVTSTRTTGVGSDPQVTDRTFTTPSVGFQYRNQGAPGAVELRTSLRATQRGSSGDLVDPATLVQVYELALVRRTPVSEWRFGRFYSPYESFSGYWDGLLVHRGTDRFGAGFLAGFEPDRGNSGLRSTEPKVGMVLHGRTKGRAVSYRSEFALNVFFPKDAPTTHVMTGWGQGMQAGPWLLSNALQIDRETLTGHWVVTRLQTRLSRRLGDGGTAYVGHAIRQPYLDRTEPGVIPFRRDQLNAGFATWGGALGWSFDVARSHQEGYADQWSYAGSLSHRSARGTGLGATLAGTWWTDGRSNGALVSPSLSRRFGASDLSLGYQLYRSDVAGNVSTSHAVDLGGRFPLAGRSQFTVRARQRVGGHLKSSGLYAGLWYPF